LDDVSLVIDDNFEVDVVDFPDEFDEGLTADEELVVVVVLLTEMDLVEVLTVVLVGSETLVLVDDDFEVERDETLEILVVLDIELVGEDFELKKEKLS
jgi:hypothetical protein